MPRPITFGVTILIFINGWLLGDIFTQPSEINLPPVEQIGWTPKLVDLGQFQVPKESPTAHQQILARPVFIKSRRPFFARQPPPRAIPASPATAFIIPSLMLRGVMINGSTKKAYIAEKMGQSGAWIDEGKDFGGWQVQSVSKDMAKLQKQTHTIELQLYPSH